ncbi:MAG: GNAT family N-acetyltransferase [Acidimicrobiia bacterium]|nr:GNAT family N-acetyltransferase [Acidimicrobiia bacterium]
MSDARPFVADDHASVRDLILAGMRERWGDAYEPSANPDLDDIRSTYVDRGADVVVIEAGGRIIATGTLVPLDHGTGQIVRMSVDARHRREGLARGVVEHLLRRARERGLAEVIVLTDTPWVSARALYRACGFVETGHDDTDTHFSRRLDQPG